MKLTQFYLPTLRQAPNECDTISAKLMFRAGMIRKVASGIYEWLPLGLRVLKKVEQIIREEMNTIGGLEVWLPHLMPKEPWQETGRWNVYGKELFRLKDRKNSDFCLAPTAEEIITGMIRNEVRSYKMLPLMFYQFGTKFRDEIRPRFGVIRSREFYMKDAYSFHRDEKCAEDYYKLVYDAYCKIFTRCGLKFLPVDATTGAIGGKFSHEFMVVSGKEDNESLAGEEIIVFCKKCNYAANIEKAECVNFSSQVSGVELKKLEEVNTPSVRTVEEVSKFLNQESKNFIKTLIYVSEEVIIDKNKKDFSNTTKSDNKKIFVVLVRGDLEINETKLKEKLGVNEIKLADNDLVKDIFGIEVGFLGPVNLKLKIASYDLKIIADKSVYELKNGITGANKKDFHLKNVNIYRDYKPDLIEDLRNITVEDVCPRCGNGGLNFSKGIEVGHTFKLGTKYSESMKATFLDETGKEINFVMGCYGIGVSRVVSASIEQSNDEDGIIWYPAIAPFDVYLLPIDYKDLDIKNLTDQIYLNLKDKKLEILLDDRDERPGVKFKDADLIGIPVRITVSKKLLPDNKVEVYIRKTKEVRLVLVDKLDEEVSGIIELLKKI